ncbi:MAG TPA: DNA polymerase III subunit delta, partial [Myxococcaceae bacterium]|nr:DNA polymerase III subunit delta [Myxococcaceae bacterium]
ALAAKAGWGAAQLGFTSAEAWREMLDVDLSDADFDFLREVAAFAQEERLTAPEGDASALVGLLEQGLPPGHALVLVATDVDPKNPLVKKVAAVGELVARKVEARLKDLDLSEVVASALKPFGKRLEPGAEARLKERVGGNMRLLQSELEKLALHAHGPTISSADVDLLVGHAREEEYLALSDALQKRELAAALKYLAHALEQGAHPLLLLGSVAGIVRTLLVTRERLSHLAAGKVPRGFDDFKRTVFPKVEQEAKGLGTKVPHPYAAFMSMQSAAKFRREELLGALAACADADVALKSSVPGALALERVVWAVCGAAPAPSWEPVSRHRAR